MASRAAKCDDLLASAGKEWIGTDKKRAGASLTQESEGRVDLARGAGLDDTQLPAKRMRGLLRAPPRVLGFGIVRVYHQSDESCSRNELVQHSQRLAPPAIRAEEIGSVPAKAAG
jgi:hypothetical protein